MFKNFYICKKYGLEYLDEHGMGIGNIPIPGLLFGERGEHEGLLTYLSRSLLRIKGVLKKGEGEPLFHREDVRYRSLLL
jgi:hypothetical protein